MTRGTINARPWRRGRDWRRRERFAQGRPPKTVRGRLAWLETRLEWVEGQLHEAYWELNARRSAMEQRVQDLEDRDG